MPQATERTAGPRPVNRTPSRRLPFPLSLYQTAVGKKWVMALTGIALLGYVLVHMIGNLKLFFGPEDINHYGEWLRELLYPAMPRTVTLWLMRLGLIAAFVLHIHSAYSLTRMNERARPTKYQGDRNYIAADFAGRTMRWSGVIVLLFLIWHLADLTWGLANPDFIRGDPYHNVVESLTRLPIAVLYIVANLALGLHIFHGAWSMFQSLGANSPKFNPIRRPFAIGFAAIIVIGNLSFPLAVQFGLISEDDRTTPYADEVDETDETDEEALAPLPAPTDLVVTIPEVAR
jgi:succinate dehydrogenase / fumarate reductase cytochrome b subunit